MSFRATEEREISTVHLYSRCGWRFLVAALLEMTWGPDKNQEFHEWHELSLKISEIRVIRG
jgi:hypothetical protein